MCITRNELEKKIEELRSLKALKEETENELKALEHEVISYMTENELTEEITNNAKITYKPQSRTTLDKAKLKGDIWIITEADRSATTVLFPDEY